MIDLFLALLLLPLLNSIYLMKGLLIPAGHDAFQYLTLQYYFLNNAVFSGDVPQWMPYMTMGTVASWWYGIQSGFVQNSLALFAPWLRSVNFIYLFHLGMLFDDLVLVLGCWLLAKRYLKSEVAVFIYCASVWAGAIWLTQPWFNFHSYYCLPLILHFFHRFLEDGRWRYFLGGCHLIFMQYLGNLPYFLPVLTLIIFLYFAIAVVSEPGTLKKFLGRVRLNIYGLLSLAIVAATGWMVYHASTFGTDQIVNYNFGREPDGTTKLANFLGYGGGLDFFKWKELVLGFSPELNYNLYAGVIILPLVIWTLLFRLSRKIAPLVGVVLVLLNFSVGGFAAVFFYETWPLMKYFRHLALVSPIIKIFLFLIAAFGLDWFLRVSARESCQQKLKSLFPAIGLIVVFVVLYTVPRNMDFIGLVDQMVPKGRPDIFAFMLSYGSVVGDRLNWVTMISLAAALAWWTWGIVGSQRLKRYAMISIVILQLADVCAFRLYETGVRSASAADFKSTMNFVRPAFENRRDASNGWRASPRAGIIASLPLGKHVQYWSNDSFLFRDSVGNEFRTDHWLSPLDRFLKVYWGQKPEDWSAKPPRELYFPKLKFPVDSVLARKSAGVDEDKIQFFSDALSAKDEKRIAAGLVSEHYAGDIPLVFDRDAETTNWEERLKENARADVSYAVREFSTDTLTMAVEAARPGWLFYSDVWHPLWHAEVNGREVTVKRSNLAFKIIAVPEGTSEVRFYFGSPWIKYCRKFLSVLSFLWVGLTLAMVFAEVRSSKGGRRLARTKQ